MSLSECPCLIYNGTLYDNYINKKKQFIFVKKIDTKFSAAKLFTISKKKFAPYLIIQRFKMYRCESYKPLYEGKHKKIAPTSYSPFSYMLFVKCCVDI